MFLHVYMYVYWSWLYDNTNESSNLGQTVSDLIIINKNLEKNFKKKTTCKVVDSAVPADHRIKLKESEKKDKYLDIARELEKKNKKKLWNMKVTFIPVVIGALCTVTEGSIKGMKDL